jgi:hypothetical protein
MKQHTRTKGEAMKLHKSIQSLTLALCVTLAALTLVQAQDTPGIMLGDVVVMTATVEAIDQKDRAVALRGQAGNVFVVEIDDAVKNFKQIKVGDQVRVEYYEAVAVYFGKAGEHPAEDAETIVATAPKGQKPGGMAIEAVDVSATVQAIDRTARTVTITGPEGNAVTVKVDPSVRGFDHLQVGASIHTRYVEAVAVSVEKP